VSSSAVVMSARERKNERERARRLRIKAAREGTAVITPLSTAVEPKAPSVPIGTWIARADCRNYDPDLWFSPIPNEQEKAKAVCAGCPVSAACLQWSVATRQQFGIWGGIDREQVRQDVPA
jgi:WhiB family transcriptional regulator, redox-sensing transcriptional regulator